MPVPRFSFTKKKKQSYRDPVACAGLLGAVLAKLLVKNQVAWLCRTFKSGMLVTCVPFPLVEAGLDLDFKFSNSNL